MVGQSALRIALTAMGMAAALTGTAGQEKTLHQKACTMRAATMLPAVPGLSISGVSAAEVSADSTLTAQARAIFSERGARGFLDDYGSYDALTLDKVERAFRMGQYTVGREQLVAFGLSQTAISLRVEVAVNAATLSATYAFACVVTKDGNVNVYPRGLTK